MPSRHHHTEDEDARMGEDGGQWGGIEGSIEDPEEVKVIFCALDSFL